MDITEQKKVEIKLKETLDNLDYLVKKRTAELEEVYISLEKNEKGLSEAHRIVPIGNWQQNIIKNKIYLSNEVYRIYGLNPQEFEATYDFCSYLYPDNRDRVDGAFKKLQQKNPFPQTIELSQLMEKSE